MAIEFYDKSSSKVVKNDSYYISGFEGVFKIQWNGFEYEMDYMGDIGWRVVKDSEVNTEEVA